MPKKVYCIAAVAVLVGLAGLVAAQVAGTKPEEGAVVTVKEKAKPITVEERIINIEKNQQKILADLKEIKDGQKEILQWTRKIFTRMERR